MVGHWQGNLYWCCEAGSEPRSKKRYAIEFMLAYSSVYHKLPSINRTADMVYEKPSRIKEFYYRLRDKGLIHVPPDGPRLFVVSDREALRNHGDTIT